MCCSETYASNRNVPKVRHKIANLETKQGHRLVLKIDGHDAILHPARMGLRWLQIIACQLVTALMMISRSAVNVTRSVTWTAIGQSRVSIGGVNADYRDVRMATTRLDQALSRLHLVCQLSAGLQMRLKNAP